MRWWKWILLIMVVLAVIGGGVAYILYKPPFFALVNDDPKITVSLKDKEAIGQMSLVYATRLVLLNAKRVRLVIVPKPEDGKNRRVIAWQKDDGTALPYTGYDIAVNDGVLEMKLWMDTALMREYGWDEEKTGRHVGDALLRGIGEMNTKVEAPGSRAEEAEKLVQQIDYAEVFGVVFNQDK